MLYDNREENDWLIDVHINLNWIEIAQALGINYEFEKKRKKRRWKRKGYPKKLKIGQRF